MTYVITQACIDVNDKSCLEVCPVDCIYEASRMLLINPDECIDCGACLPECPVEAIYQGDELPDELAPFMEINRAVLAGTGEADRLVETYVRAYPLPAIPGRRG